MDITLNVVEIKNTKAVESVSEDDADALRVYRITVNQGGHEYYYEIDADLFDIQTQGGDLPGKVHALFIEADLLFGVK